MPQFEKILSVFILLLCYKRCTYNFFFSYIERHVIYMPCLVLKLWRTNFIFCRHSRYYHHFFRVTHNLYEHVQKFVKRIFLLVYVTHDPCNSAHRHAWCFPCNSAHRVKNHHLFNGSAITVLCFPHHQTHMCNTYGVKKTSWKIV